MNWLYVGHCSVLYVVIVAKCKIPSIYLPSAGTITCSGIKGYANKTGVESFWILLDG